MIRVVGLLQSIVDNGYCALRVHAAAAAAAAAAGTGSLMAGEADAGVGVPATQDADVAGGLQITECTYLPFGSAFFC